MDFFIDSGVVIGYADGGDPHFHEPCKSFVRKYPFGSNGYYSLKYLILQEIRETELKRREQRKKNIVKLFTQRAKIFLDQIQEVTNTTHASLKLLFNQIHAYLLAKRKDLKRKEHDARFLTSAFIWDYEDKTLATPHFITTDWCDICENKQDLTDIANKELSTSSSLNIQFVIDMVT